MCVSHCSKQMFKTCTVYSVLYLLGKNETKSIEKMKIIERCTAIGIVQHIGLYLSGQL